MEQELIGRSSSCPEKCRSGLETLPKVLALHFVAVSHALNIPKALAIVGCRLTVSRLCLFLWLHVDKVSGYVLQPSEFKPNVTPLTVLAHVLCAIKSYAHLLYVQRLIPHQVCCRIRFAFCCFCCFIFTLPCFPHLAFLALCILLKLLHHSYLHSAREELSNASCPRGDPWRPHSPVEG